MKVNREMLYVGQASLSGLGWSMDYACAKTSLNEEQIAILAEDFNGAWVWKQGHGWFLSGRFIDCLFKSCGVVNCNTEGSYIPTRNIDPDMFCPMCSSMLDLNDDECVACGWAFLKHVQRQK